MTTITKDKFIKACKGSAGIRADVAERLQVTRSAVTNFLKRHPDMQHYLTEADEAINDLSESEMIKRIKRGKWDAIKFRLMTKAKDRGYVERTEHDHKSENVTVIFKAGEAYPDIKTADEIDDREDT